MKRLLIVAFLPAGWTAVFAYLFILLQMDKAPTVEPDQHLTIQPVNLHLIQCGNGDPHCWQLG